MKKTIRIFATIMSLMILFSACGVQSTDNGLPSNQKHVQEETSQEAGNNRVDPQNDRPGTISKNEIIQGIANWAEIEDGILKAEQQIDIDTWFVSDEAKSIIKSKSITLEDDTLFGYLVFNNGKDVSEYLLRVLTEKATSTDFELYVDYYKHNDYLFFIISKPESLNDFIGYMSNCRSGDLAMQR